MIEFMQLIDFVDLNIKNNIKEGTYLKLMELISKAYISKADVPSDYDSDDPEHTNDIY